MLFSLAETDELFAWLLTDEPAELRLDDDELSESASLTVLDCVSVELASDVLLESFELLAVWLIGTVTETVFGMITTFMV